MHTIPSIGHRLRRRLRIRSRWAGLAIIIALVGTLTVAQTMPASAWTIQYPDGVRMIFTSRELTVDGVKATFHAEFRSDGTYFWWLDANNTSGRNRDVYWNCVFWFTPNRIPLQVHIDEFLGRHSTATYRSPMPTLASPYPYMPILAEQWNASMESFDASCKFG